MACNSPLQAFRLADGSVQWSERGDVVATLEIPCGRCQGCRLERSRQWAVRCTHELQLHERNCFVTLTYDEEHLPPGQSLRHSDFVLFMRRLRRKRGAVRFFMCGEYGEGLGRPHYHAILFGCDFSDRELCGRTKSGLDDYSSVALTDLWPLGRSRIGDANFKSAGYVGRYIMGKELGESAGLRRALVDPVTGEMTFRAPEYCQMSRRPGIAYQWLLQYWSDVVPFGKTVINGVEVKVPRYYDKIIARVDPELFEEIVYRRRQAALPHAADNTRARLAVKETVLKAKLSHLKREL